jgi:alginate O-acetyltransferase complex protein AlgI
MGLVEIIAAAVGAVAFLGLILAAHRPAHVELRAALALIAAAALVTIVTGRPLALLFFALSALLVVGTWALAATRFWLAWVGVLIAALVAAKLPWPGGTAGSSMGLAGLGIALWVGVSYLIFRLIHVTLDVHKGRTDRPPLPELLIYALHPASLVAGPIDRVQNSLQAQAEATPLRDDLHQGLWRILLGAVVKYAIANPLYALVAAHDMAANPDRPVGIAWLWLLAYSFYLLADFSSYTDIAIGFGTLAGLRLPENFTRPYLAPSLTVFWQRWHITLSTWARDYVFFPLARWLRTRLDSKRRDLVQFIAHIATMLTIGLWHGLTPGYAAWGLWHGLGMFGTGQLARRRKRRPLAEERIDLRQVLSVAGTFLFVTLGWVLFAADLPTALRIYARLFGIA